MTSKLVLGAALLSAALSSGGTYAAWSFGVGTRLAVVEAKLERADEDRRDMLDRLQHIEDKLDALRAEAAVSRQRSRQAP